MSQDMMHIVGYHQIRWYLLCIEFMYDVTDVSEGDEEIDCYNLSFEGVA